MFLRGMASTYLMVLLMTVRIYTCHFSEGEGAQPSPRARGRNTWLELELLQRHCRLFGNLAPLACLVVTAPIANVKCQAMPGKRDRKEQERNKERAREKK
jgi:hypothetical protein